MNIGTSGSLILSVLCRCSQIMHYLCLLLFSKHFIITVIFCG